MKKVYMAKVQKLFFTLGMGFLLGMAAITLWGMDWNPVRGPEGYQTFTPYLSVRQFNARGDGKTDDTLSIQKALDVAAQKGDVVWFPPGIYPISKTLRVNRSVSLKGAGQLSTVFKVIEAVDPVLKFEGPGNEWGVTHEHFQIDGNRKAKTGITVDKYSMTFRDIRLINFSGKAIANRNFGTLFDRISTLNSDVGISLEHGDFSGSNGVSITNCKIAGNKSAGIAVAAGKLQSTGIFITNNIFDVNGAAIKLINDGVGAPPMDVFINNNRFEKNGLALDVGKKVRGAKFISNAVNGSRKNTPKHHIQVDSPRTIIAFNRFAKFKNSAIKLSPRAKKTVVVWNTKDRSGPLIEEKVGLKNILREKDQTERIFIE